MPKCWDVSTCPPSEMLNPYQTGSALLSRDAILQKRGNIHTSHFDILDYAVNIKYNALFILRGVYFTLIVRVLVVWKHTQGDTLDGRSLGIRKVPVNLFNDFLFHLWDSVTVQHFHRADIRTLAMDQHLQSLRRLSRSQAPLPKYTVGVLYR